LLLLLLLCCCCCCWWGRGLLISGSWWLSLVVDRHLLVVWVLLILLMGHLLVLVLGVFVNHSGGAVELLLLPLLGGLFLLLWLDGVRGDLVALVCHIHRSVCRGGRFAVWQRWRGA